MIPWYLEEGTNPLHLHKEFHHMPLSEPFLGKLFLSSQISDHVSLEWHLKRAWGFFFNVY